MAQASVSIIRQSLNIYSHSIILQTFSLTCCLQEGLSAVDAVHMMLRLTHALVIDHLIMQVQTSHSGTCWLW